MMSWLQVLACVLPVSLSSDTTSSCHEFNTGGFEKLCWALADGMVHLEASARSAGYVAVGFNDQPAAMLGADAVVAWQGSDGSAVFGDYMLGGFSSREVQVQNNQNLTNVVVSIEAVDGLFRTHLAFSRSLNGRVSIDPNAAFVIGAVGPTPGALSAVRRHTEEFAVSLNLTSGAAGSVVHPPMRTSLLVAHGVLMTFAFGLLLPLGVVFAAYCKHLQKWFLVHRVLQTMAVGCMVLSLLMVYASEGIVNTYHWHPLLGYIVLVLVLWQPLNACCRPHKEASNRGLWRRIHKVSGSAAMVLGAMNLLLGLYFLDVSQGYVVLYWLCATGWMVAFIVLQLRWSKSAVSYGRVDGGAVSLDEHSNQLSL